MRLAFLTVSGCTGQGAQLCAPGDLNSHCVHHCVLAGEIIIGHSFHRYICQMGIIYCVADIGTIYLFIYFGYPRLLDL